MNITRAITNISGTDVHWTELGTGSPVVLIHGLTDSHKTWSRLAPILAQSHRVLMPDLPGHGLSGRPDESYSLSWHAQIIADWMGSIGVEQSDVVGHSFGGGVAQWLLLERRARVRRLGLIASGGLGRDVTWSLRLASLSAFEHLGQPFMGAGTNVALKTLGARFDADEVEQMSWMNSTPGTARAVARTVRDVIDLRGQRRGFLQHAHELDELPAIGVYWGDRDPIIPMKHALELASHLDGVSVTRFADCGHFPHREKPTEIALALGLLIDSPFVPASRLRTGHSPSQSVRRRTFWVRAWSSFTGSIKRAIRRILRGGAIKPKPTEIVTTRNRTY